MHGPAFSGDTGAALDALADDYDRRTAVWRERQLAAAQVGRGERDTGSVGAN